MKYLFFDYDGTLAYNGVISDTNKEYLDRVRAMGHKIFLNTGRSKGNMPDHVLREIPFDGLVCGAGYMEYEGRVLFEYHLPPHILQTGLDFARRQGVRVLFEGVEAVYSNHPNQWLLDIEEHLPFRDELRITNMTVAATLDDEHRGLFDGAKLCELPTYFETMPAGVSKVTGLRYLEEHMGVDHEDIIVFGDSENDLEMVRYAHTSVIMRHAPDILDQYAYIRTSSEADGVAEGIIKLFDMQN